LQQIQDSFAEANSVASTLTDVEGIPITVPSNHSKVCSMIRATEKGLGNCIFSGKQLGREVREGQKSIHHKCCGIGFHDAAAPIVVNGKHIANWLIGQYYIGDVDQARVKEYAEEIGASPDMMIQEFENMPKMSLQEFEKKLVFLEVMARELSLMGYQNLIQRRQNIELNSIKEELEKHQFQLEIMVEERTADLQQANQKLTSEISQKTKIQKRQNRLTTAIESAAESIIITSPAGKIIYVNPAFEKLTGYSPREVIGKKPSILNSGFHDENFYSNLWRTILSGDIWVGRVTNKKKDGTLYQEESTISPVKDDHGKVLNFVAVKKDITKEIELEAQLHQAQKLESIGTLAAGMAHEINTPIQYLLSNTQFLKEVLDDFIDMQTSYETLVDAASTAGAFSEQVSAITQMAEEIDLKYLRIEADNALKQSLEGILRISSIVTAMKEFALPGSAEKLPEDLNRIIESTIEVSCSQWQDVAEIELHLEKELPLVPLVAGSFKQVLLGLINNATFALTEKHNSEVPQKGRITITTKKLGELVELRLADTGIGISDTIIEKIFDPFFTTKPVGKGRGQGLSVAHGTIVDQHNGTIKVSSILGKGTEFIITLPLL
ncbi:MAG: PocR ligand-binding domain-containing protein, partial [Proteobacteria bacterium]|nr:PocR ligand-binding domain-containing protein [Pseudomonadota bacterium]